MFKNLLFLIAAVAFAYSFTTQSSGSIEGTYAGTLSYISSKGKMINALDAEATLSKNKDKTYSITFSNGVPALQGLIFNEEGGSYATISSSNSVSGIQIEDGELDVAVMKGGDTWAFSGEK